MSSILYLFLLESFIWIQVSIIVIFLILVPIFFYYASRNEFARDALYNGWTPIIIAMIISRYILSLTEKQPFQSVKLFTYACVFIVSVLVDILWDTRCKCIVI